LLTDINHIIAASSASRSIASASVIGAIPITSNKAYKRGKFWINLRASKSWDARYSTIIITEVALLATINFIITTIIWVAPASGSVKCAINIAA
jgi:hypothetical protein